MMWYLFIALSISSIINSAERAAHQNVDDQIQIGVMQSLLQNNNISIKGKKVFNFCYCTEAFSVQLTQEADSVHSYGPKKEMVDAAITKYRTTKNIVFSQMFPQNGSQDLAIGIFSLDLIKKKEAALKDIYNSLKSGGECFFTMVTSDNPLPLNVQVGREIISSSLIAPFVETIKSMLLDSDSVSVTDPYLSSDELKKIISNTGFTIEKFERQECSFLFPNSQAVENCYRSLFMNIDMVQLADQFFNRIPDFIRPEYCTTEYHIQEFFKKIMTKMKKTDAGEYDDTLTTTIVHVKKP